MLRKFFFIGHFFSDEREREAEGGGEREREKRETSRPRDGAFGGRIDDLESRNSVA